MSVSEIALSLSVRPSFSPHGTTRLPINGSSWNFIYENFSKICHENSSVIKIWQRTRGTLQDGLRVFVIISGWILLRIRNVSDKFCR